MDTLVNIACWSICAYLCAGLSATSGFKVEGRVLKGDSVTKTNETRVEQVVEGDNLLVVCNANKTVDVDIFWTKNDINSTFRQNGTLLTFVKINRRSAGVYVCYSVNKTTGHKTDNNASVVETVDVDVQFPAEVTHFSITPRTVLENHTLTITCTVIGNPVPQYSISHLYYTNTSKLSGTVTFTSRPTVCRYSGLWTCSAENTLNDKTSTEAAKEQNVTVLCSPIPRMSSLYYTVTSRPGDQARLTMYNEGYPFPNYTWTHNGAILPKSMHTDYISYEWQFSILNISSVNYTDFGNYSVTMTNDIGSYVAHYQLLPIGPPLPPTNLTVSDVTSTGAKLRWVSGFDMWLNQTFVIYRYISDSTFALVHSIYPNYTNHGVDQVFTYELKGLDSGTNYALEVASKVPGYAGYTNAVRFKTKGMPPAKSPQTNSAEVILTSSIQQLTLMVLFLSFIFILGT